MKRKLLLLLISSLLLLSAVVLQLASASTRPSLTLTATSVGSQFAGSGCGLHPGHDVYIYLYKADSGAELAAVATHDDANGCFSFATGYLFDAAGPYSAYVYQTKPNTGPGSYNQNHPVIDLDFSVS